MPALHRPARRTLLGYSLALCAGALWGTTGPLSTALYSEGAVLTDVGFWRVLLATLGLLRCGAFRPPALGAGRRTRPAAGRWRAEGCSPAAP